MTTGIPTRAAINSAHIRFTPGTKNRIVRNSANAGPGPREIRLIENDSNAPSSLTSPLVFRAKTVFSATGASAAISPLQPQANLRHPRATLGRAGSFTHNGGTTLRHKTRGAISPGHAAVTAMV